MRQIDTLMLDAVEKLEPPRERCQFMMQVEDLIGLVIDNKRSDDVSNQVGAALTHRQPTGCDDGFKAGYRLLPEEW